MIRTVAAVLSLLIPVCGSTAQPAFAPAQPKSQVFFVMDQYSLVNGFDPSPSVARRMVDSLVRAVSGRRTVAEAWASFVSPEDVVGIKVASAPGGMGGTHPAVVDAVAAGLREAGVPAGNIVVWDRNKDDLMRAGFSASASNYRLAWVDPATGYDRKAVLTAPVLGRLIWGDSRFGQREGTRLVDILSQGDQLSSTSFYATVLSQRVTKVINIPSLCDSFMCGINGAIANMTLWNVDNWRRFVKESYGDPYLAEIYADPMVRDKVVLTIMDGLALQFAGGPFPNPNFVRQNFTLFASLDPVAIDATALRLIEEYRVVNKLPKITTVAGHIESAAAMGLGQAAEEQIEMIRAGTEGYR